MEPLAPRIGCGRDFTLDPSPPGVKLQGGLTEEGICFAFARLANAAAGVPGRPCARLPLPAQVPAIRPRRSACRPKAVSATAR
jgi:hypothetical protein